MQADWAYGTISGGMFFFHGDDYSAVYCEIEPLLASLERDVSFFLHVAEQQELNKIKAENYRRSWTAARICAKYLWAAPADNRDLETADIPWSELNIVSRNDKGQGIRPVLNERGLKIDRDLSISHTDDAVFVVLANRPDCRIGCDLVPLGSVTPKMARLFFRNDEDLPTDPHWADRYWAVKEAAYKAGNYGQAFAPVSWRIARRNATDAFFCRDASFENGIEVPVVTFLHSGHVVAVAVIR